MKTAIELADMLTAGSGLIRNDLLESAAMLRQQAEQLSVWLAANGPGGWIDDLRNKCEALEITNDALKADAERYRWLSRNPTYLGWDADFEAEFVDFEVDKAIDAMKGKS